MIYSNGEEFNYTKSNKNVAEDILFAEDNFISSEKNIDDISEVTADNYSVTEIQTQNYLNLAQDKFIFYSKEN